MQRILVIEDENDIRQLLRFNLEREGFAVLEAADGLGGLHMATSELPDLVVLDLMLPGMDGCDVCRRLKAQPVTAAIPVLMLTARGEEVDRIVGLTLGADDYVVKPFSVRELVLRIRAILRRGNRLFCLATDDNHDRFPPEHPLCDSFGGFVMIKAPKLDYETIFAALEHGDFYASMGPEIHSLTFEDGMLHVETSEVRSIHMTTNARRAEVLHAEHGKTIHEATFHVLPSDGYIRLQIIDREGMRANSNAYFTDTLFA